MHRWLVSHGLTWTECNYKDCSGKGLVIAHGDGVALKCTTCNKISVGGHRGFWRMGKLGTVMMVNIVFSIIIGFSLSQLEQFVDINKNTWSSYIQYVGIVLGETLERNRRDPEHKYELAQWDETAFGKRKYQRGKRVRKSGVQWALTVVKVNPVTNKTEEVDIQFLPYNRRSAAQITPLVVQRMKIGGTMLTDCWKAYVAAAKEAGVEHRTVNHSEGFINKDTGDHTNNVEGIHKILKKHARDQFGRLPYLTSGGKPYYIDLVCWRTNIKLKRENFWRSFCKALQQWVSDPLEDWDRTVPVCVDEPEFLSESDSEAE